MYVFDRSRTIVHELLVHGENSANDFYDNGKIDSKKSVNQEHLDARATNSRYSTFGFSVISQIINVMGVKMSETQIRKTMYQFVD